MKIKFVYDENMPTHDIMSKHVRARVAERAFAVESVLGEFIKSTGLDPRQCELVIHDHYTGPLYIVKERTFPKGGYTIIEDNTSSRKIIVKKVKIFLQKMLDIFGKLF